MQLRDWRRAAGLLVLTALGLAGFSPARARADGSGDPPRGNERVVKIGPQAVVIVDDEGHARMYDDPSQQAPACRSTRECWGQALGALGVFSAMVYEELTSSVEGGGRAAESSGTSE